MDPIGTGSRRILRTAQGVSLAFLVAFALHAQFWRGDGLDGLFNDWVYNGLVVGAATLCIVRGLRQRGDRLPWLLIGFALALWSAA